MRGDCPRVSGGKRFPPLSFRGCYMRPRTLSVFVDESGRFQHPDALSRFYIVGLVFHDQDADISEAVRQLDANAEELGLDHEAFVFHAGPLIRMEKGYGVMNRRFRGRIFDRMMTFARHVDFRYHCLCVDKKYIDSSLQILSRLKGQLEDFIRVHHDELTRLGRVKVYYDCGQSPVTNLLHDVFKDIGCSVEFAQKVEPRNYKLFQVADLICTVTLIEQKLLSGDHMSESEHRFFGGPKAFMHNVMRKIKRKELA